METMIVEICLGATNQTVDFMLPAHVQVSSMLDSMLALVEQAFQGISFQGVKPMLCDLTTGQIIPENLSLAQAGVRDSHRLLLV